MSIRLGTVFIVLGVCVTVFLLWVGVDGLVGSRRLQARIRDARAEPLSLEVDLSRTGHVEGDFRHILPQAHRLDLLLHVRPGFSSNEEVTRRLTGLKGTITIRTVSGEPAWSDNINSLSFQIPLTSPGHEPVPRLNLPGHVLSRGNYVLELDVEQPAPALAGTPQHLSARYVLCGLESLYARLMLYLGLGSFAVAALVGGPTLCALLRRRRLTIGRIHEKTQS